MGTEENPGSAGKEKEVLNAGHRESPADQPGPGRGPLPGGGALLWEICLPVLSATTIARSPASRAFRRLIFQANSYTFRH